jgi:diguanylate cyclase (GGDEF)-like protein
MTDPSYPLLFVIDAQAKCIASTIDRTYFYDHFQKENEALLDAAYFLTSEQDELSAALAGQQSRQWRSRRPILGHEYDLYWQMRPMDPANGDQPVFLLAAEARRSASNGHSPDLAVKHSAVTEDTYRACFLALSTPALLWKLDELDEIHLVQINPAAERFSEGWFKDLLGLSLDDIFTHIPTMVNAIQETLRTGSQHVNEQVFSILPGSEKRWIDFEALRINDQIVLCLLYDVTATKEKLLREENTRGEIELLRQAMTAFTVVLNLRQLEDRVLEYLRRLIPFDQALLFLQDRDEVECIAEAGFGEEPRFVGQRIPAANPQFEALNRNRMPLYLSNAQDYKPFKSLGELNCGKSWLGVPLLVHGQISGYLSIYNQAVDFYGAAEADLAQTFASEVAIAVENARLFEQLQQMAITDGLTGLFNRRHFFELGEIELRRSRRYHNSLSLLMLDVDNFKKFNDQHGHAFGDQVLVMISRCMRTVIREVDLLGRYGGEEFVILLPETSLEAGIEVAERLRYAIANCLAGDNLVITVSIGIASLDDRSRTFDDLLQWADQALYRAKQAGKNCVMQ